MGHWICIRKLNRWHWVPFIHQYIHLPTPLCKTLNKETHLGWGNRILEFGYLKMGEENELEVKDEQD